MPSISIIVPVYNAKKYLPVCVESILAQTLTEIELILVDDGSTDDSPAICDAYATQDSRVQVIHKRNGGVSSARKAGVAKASAPFVGFVDADDFVSETMFETLFTVAIKQDADLVECGYCEVDDDTEQRMVHQETCVLEQAQIKKDVLTPLLNETGEWHCLLGWSCWNKLYRTSILADALKMDDETISIGEDFLQNVFFLTQCKRAVLLKDACHYFYRQTDISVMHSKKVHIGELAYLQRGIACAPHLGYTGDGLRNIMTYRAISDMLWILFYSPQLSVNEKVNIMRQLVQYATNKRHLQTHLATQGKLTQLCLRLLLTNCKPIQWSVIALLGRKKSNEQP